MLHFKGGQYAIELREPQLPGAMPSVGGGLAAEYANGLAVVFSEVGDGLKLGIKRLVSRRRWHTVAGSLCRTVSPPLTRSVSNDH